MMGIGVEANPIRRFDLDNVALRRKQVELTIGSQNTFIASPKADIGDERS
jgi:hypothetical protein